jgi:Leucine-rich repeat (LRR) protein
MKRSSLTTFIPFDLVNVIFTLGSKYTNSKIRCSNPYVFEIPKQNVITDMNYSPAWKHFVNVQSLYCGNLDWTTIPEELLDVNINLFRIIIIWTKLTELPRWNYVRTVSCLWNDLTKLPDWPNVQIVNCSNNKLTELPYWPNVQGVCCNYNPELKIPNWPNVKFVNQ